jgi:hypothetical protein
MENRTIELKENWLKWNPTRIREGVYIVTQLLQDVDGTKVMLSNEEQVVEAFFDGYTPIVRSAAEGIRVRTWEEVQQKYSDKSFFRNWFLYIVENSLLLQWVEEESCGFYEKEKLKHFCIVTGEELIDIVSTFDPIINERRIHNSAS